MRVGTGWPLMVDDWGVCPAGCVRVGCRFLPRRTRSTTGVHGGVAVSDYETPQSVPQADGVEVQLQADADLAHAEVGQDWGIVRGKQGCDRFDFQEDGVGDQDVGAKSRGEGFAFINDGNGDLPLEMDAGLVKFLGQAFATNRFQKAGSYGSMHLDREADDAIGQVSMFQHRRTSVQLRGPSCSPW
jgi:hypothetical protein